MIKILHSADWHMDSPIQGRSEAQTALLKAAILEIPHKVAAAARAEGCDLMLLAGDLFDGPYSPESLKALKDALAEADMPVFITPGNHDYLGPQSPWLTETWPENVFIFTQNHMESAALPALDCRIWGGGFTGPDCEGLLEGFRAEGPEAVHIGILHGDPTQASSPYCPVTERQAAASGLAYLALGHIHKGGDFRAGDTLCAWPGCPMGRGYDEQGDKGVLIVSIENGRADTRFLPLDTPRFYDWECDAGADAAASLADLLPAAGSQDFYRITLTGESEPLELNLLAEQFSRFPNLLLRDRTVPPIDLWASAGDDTLEGIYFRLLQDAMEGQEEAQCRRVLLAAKISRQLLSGQEVKLP